MVEFKINVTGIDGRKHVLSAPAGTKVMEVLRDAGVGVKGECGGSCSCGTCHVYVDPSWANSIDPTSPAEEGVLDQALSPREDSRLSCQIIMSADLDGLTLVVAPN